MSVIQKLDTNQAIPYIRGVAAKFLEYLLILKDDKSGLDSQQALITASLNFAEVLVAKAEDDKSKILTTCIYMVPQFYLSKSTRF
jgi:hypothetical protein